jgi:plastocyanin
MTIMNSHYLRPALLIATSLTLLAGCPEDKPSGTAGTQKPGPAPKAPTPTATSTSDTGSAEAFGKGVITGTVTFTGDKHPEMKVPKARNKAKFCQDDLVKHDAILIEDGKIQDVWVGVASDQVSGDYEGKELTLDQKNCLYVPRMLALMPGQDFQVTNSDPTMHNVQAKFEGKQLFNTAQPAGADPIKNAFESTGIHMFQCSVHPWMRAFGMVTDNPFSATTGKDGTYKIEKVPDGELTIVAWHAIFGKQEKKAKVEGGEVKLDFEFDGSGEVPAINKGELDDLF